MSKIVYTNEDGETFTRDELIEGYALEAADGLRAWVKGTPLKLDILIYTVHEVADEYKNHLKHDHGIEEAEFNLARMIWALMFR